MPLGKSTEVVDWGHPEKMGKSIPVLFELA